MKKHRYVIVCSNGASWDMERDGAFTPYGLTANMTYDLPELLAKGWRPVRETPFGGVGDLSIAFCLVLLEKDKGPATVEAAEE